MNWLHYLVEANLYLAVFYLGYHLFLSRETYYLLNRAYLLISCVLSFVIPVIQLGILKPVEPQITAVQFAVPAHAMMINMVQAAPVVEHFTLQDGILYSYLLGTVVLLILLIIKLYQLFRLSKTNNTYADAGYKLIYLNDSTTAFSFFNFLFIGTKTGNAATVIAHELVHIRQKHSIDIIFLELLKIINWFNPFIYLMQRSLRAVHEYIADEKTATSEADTLSYSSFLVNNAYGLSGSSITHSFFNYNLLKKRIIMLHQKRSGSLARLKYLVAVPLCAALLCASTLGFSKTYGWVDIAPHHINKITAKGDSVEEYITRMKVKIHDVSTITDKFSQEFSDGSVKFYTVKTLTQRDIKELSKLGVEVNLVTDHVTIDTNKRILPPPPPAPPIKQVKFPAPKHPAQITKKGYKYAEDGYLINGKADYRVIIIEKNGEQKGYFRNTATAAQIKLLRDKYGYTFPTMNIYAKMPPPPPAPPAKKKLPEVKLLPPVVAPDTTKGADHRSPPPPPAPQTSAANTGLTKLPKSYTTVKSVDIPYNRAPDKINLNEIEISKNKPTGYVPDDASGLLVINSTKYYMSGKLPAGEHLQFSATDSTMVDKRYKAGISGINGTIYLYGKVSIAIVRDILAVN